MNWLISPTTFFPELSYGAQHALRSLYGLLLFGTLVMTLPHWKRFFMSERWGGYAKSCGDVDVIQSPVGTTVVGIVWFSCAGLLFAGKFTLIAALVNLLVCKYFFVDMRWKGILRGMGAPGLMSYWLAAAVFFLEVVTQFAPQQRPLVLLALQWDFAFIMLSAGLYKLSAGYARNEGMEYGMVNPEWGYWWKFYKNIPPSSMLFKVLNQLAWATEVVAALLMLYPPTRFIGAMLIFGSFIYIATQIRLGLLCEMVMACCLLFCHPGSIGDAVLTACSVSGATPPAHVEQNAGSVLITAFFAIYLLMLPLAHAGLSYNLYKKKSLVRPLQLLLEKYTNFFGMIVWRVFSVDVVNFFINVYFVNKSTGTRTLYSKYGWNGSLRYDTVAESITLTCLFTTLKYYSSNVALFNERVLRYSRTLPCPADCEIELEYISVKKSTNGFDFVPVATFAVDTISDTVTEKVMDDSVSIRAAHAVSPIHEGVKPGSYVPLGG